MKKIATGLVLAVVGFGIAFYVLKSRAPAPHEAAGVAAPATAGAMRELNEVVLRVTPPPAIVSPGKTAENAATTPAPVNNNPPPPLGREFEPFLKMPLLKGPHDQFEREPREEPWATLMEGKWQTAFAANPELLAYGTPEVYCRTTRCEVRLVAFKSSTLDQRGWDQLITKGVTRRAEGDQSAPLVTGIRNIMQGNIENNGARVILYNYEYGRDPPTSR